MAGDTTAAEGSATLRSMDPTKEMARLDEQLERLEALTGHGPETWGRHDPAVSGWSVGRQVEHTLKSIVRMLAAVRDIRDGKPAAPDGSPRAIGRVLLAAGRIPRGRAESPEAVVPDEAPDVATSQALLAKAQALRAELAPGIDEVDTWAGTIPHPMLGPFTAAHWVRFVRVHTDHHLAIVDEILTA